MSGTKEVYKSTSRAGDIGSFVGGHLGCRNQACMIGTLLKDSQFCFCQSFHMLFLSIDHIIYN